MQARRPTGVPQLTIALPHPPLTRRRSSLLSASSSSPRTPRNSTSPPSFLFAAANRNSTDSWNSSNQDELDWEWKPEQTLLLFRTLDALPAHLLTPFNGPVPPSNLLDKIARGVANAKGPVEWPHSIRATRVKLMEIARMRAKESARDENHRRCITEENDYPSPSGEVLQQSTNTVSRRPLYRQSSMDFMNTAKTELKDNDNIARLSNRLQRTDRIIPNPAYHPYSRPSLHPSSSSSSSSSNSPPHSPQYSHHSSTSYLTAPNSSLSASTSRPRPIGRSASTLSNSSDPYLRSLQELAADPRVQRMRRSDSFCAPLSGKGTSYPLKRAPSFRATNRDNGSSSPNPSSDEEEKIRTKYSKKLRTNPGTVSPNAAPSAPTTAKYRTKLKDGAEIRIKKSSKSSSSTSSSNKSCSTTSSASTVTRSSRSPSTPKHQSHHQPNPEQPDPQPPVTIPSKSPNVNHRSASTPSKASPPPILRRVRVTNFAQAPARRISFGSLVPPAEEDRVNGAAEGEGLGSAFQLR